MSTVDALARLLRPAGAGIHTVTTGKSEQLALQRAIYGVDRDEAIEGAWRAALAKLAGAEVVILGVPSDVGAGFARGASFGPQRLREALLRDGSVPYATDAVVDAGDVWVVPQLLDDAMLSGPQLAASRRDMYGDAADPRPVSPLSLARAALDRIRELAPRASLLVLGGDHSVAWPALAAVAAGREDRIGILHFDAHTDLLETRLGVRYCFATWAFHANELIGRGGKLVQVGIRASGHPREHWESTLDVRQHWPDELAGRDAADVADEIVRHFEARGVEGLYVSNDIDGTDPAFASATGTPEPGGLHPDFVCALIERVGGAFPCWGSDLVEVAPPLAGAIEGEPDATLQTSVRYLAAQIALGLRRP
ncbi:MAG: arginase family protein [Sandaracinaceae bacterium]|nr:arginase family protein [Sandaracinaceae bacterium]